MYIQSPTHSVIAFITTHHFSLSATPTTSTNPKLTNETPSQLNNRMRKLRRNKAIEKAKKIKNSLDSHLETIDELSSEKISLEAQVKSLDSQINKLTIENQVMKTQIEGFKIKIEEQSLELIHLKEGRIVEQNKFRDLESNHKLLELEMQNLRGETQKVYEENITLKHKMDNDSKGVGEEKNIFEIMAGGAENTSQINCLAKTLEQTSFEEDALLNGEDQLNELTISTGDPMISGFPTSLDDDMDEIEMLN